MKEKKKWCDSVDQEMVENFWSCKLCSSWPRISNCPLGQVSSMTSLTQIVTYAASASVSASVELNLESKDKPLLAILLGDLVNR